MIICEITILLLNHNYYWKHEIMAFNKKMQPRYTDTLQYYTNINFCINTE